MASTVNVQLNWDERSIGEIEQKTIRGLVGMGYDIASRARMLAPYVTGALRNTIRVTEVSDGVVEVIAGGTFGGKKVAYAWKREEGPNRNPATEHYMENAKNAIMVGDYVRKYFGDISK
jgi:hypothetical protein